MLQQMGYVGHPQSPTVAAGPVAMHDIQRPHGSRATVAPGTSAATAAPHGHQEVRPRKATNDSRLAQLSAAAAPYSHQQLRPHSTPSLSLAGNALAGPPTRRQQDGHGQPASVPAPGASKDPSVPLLLLPQLQQLPPVLPRPRPPLLSQPPLLQLEPVLPPLQSLPLLLPLPGDSLRRPAPSSIDAHTALKQQRRHASQLSPTT